MARFRTRAPETSTFDLSPDLTVGTLFRCLAASARRVRRPARAPCHNPPGRPQKSPYCRRRSAVRYLFVPVTAALFPSPVVSILFPAFGGVNATSPTPGTLSRCTNMPCATCQTITIPTTPRPTTQNQIVLLAVQAPPWSAASGCPPYSRRRFFASRCMIRVGVACRAKPGSGVGDVPQPGAASSLALWCSATVRVAAGSAAQKTSKIKTVAVLRVHGREGGALPHPLSLCHLTETTARPRSTSRGT